MSNKSAQNRERQQSAKALCDSLQVKPGRGGECQ